MAERFDAVVVGAGPAGSAAALVLARARKSVCLLERGPFPGSKNLFGGVIYPRVLDGLLPGWRATMPVERWVTPEEFLQWKAFGLSIGFGVVESGPLVRSSYHADEQSLRYTGAEHLNTRNALASA